EREECEARKKRELTRQQEKEKRAQHYFKAVKPSVPSKPARIVQEETEEMPAVKREMPKTWWGRFMRWLNT
ncbi:MAG: hypothetical protein K2U26_01970, partial [Cyclobacteriaceae bacterium]|nr:hypothetical protein [Cyclobacteriaceae bacterium]